MNRFETAVLISLLCGPAALHAEEQLSTTTAATFSPAQLSKADSVVLQTAREGRSQKVLVFLDDGDISQRMETLRKASGDEAAAKEEARELAALRASVFPDGRLGRVIVLQTYSLLSMVFVEVPDLDALALLLAHPKIKRVAENKRAYPS
jgi:hypothetical protein